MDYEKMLEKAKAQLPETTTTKERFEIPKAIGHIQGSKTIISNFNQITSTLRREPAHLLKYLQRELATPASIDGPRLILGRKINSSLINLASKYLLRTVLFPAITLPLRMIKHIASDAICGNLPKSINCLTKNSFKICFLIWI